MKLTIEPVFIGDHRPALAMFRDQSTVQELVRVVLLRGLVRSDDLRSMVPCSNPRDIFAKANKRIRSLGFEIRAVKFPVETEIKTINGSVRSYTEFHWGVFRLGDLDELKAKISKFSD